MVLKYREINCVFTVLKVKFNVKSVIQYSIRVENLNYILNN